MRKFKYINEIFFITLFVILANIIYGSTINVLFLMFAGCILFLVAINKLVEKIFNIKIERF
ncbi:hypothetical protein GIX45_17045 [Erwinia sp. CPCC 100877]|uniref:Uncharacterized protein n=1 Tax=Enterococcus wangshanyuanii TaxID=2005703 RepID=A0ABQ1PDE7_9ENTE|nr:hypothetical protein [Erwinia sp. CPCC 100877]GGC94959.1 hypothetical protein GCM10011573_25770 [Enterococcus wangshanyuanii]